MERLKKSDAKPACTASGQGVKAQEKAACTASSQNGGETFKLDGRGERTRQGAKDCARTARSKLSGIKFDESQGAVTAISGDALDHFNKLLKENTQVAAEVKGMLKTQVTRLERSVNADCI